MWRETSKKDGRYNCIAWALGFNDIVLWPSGDLLWLRSKPAVVTVQEFTDTFALLGWRPSASADLFVPGYEKIALYVKPGNRPTHAARQCPDNGAWTAKLGGDIDIHQDHLNEFPPDPPACGGVAYGGAAHFYERRVIDGPYPSWEEVARANGQMGAVIRI
jgi:hypothetical protein